MKKNINEDVQAVNPSLYKNTDFKDRIVGSSTPTKDLINPSLLADIDKAATQAGIKVSITTAVSGHDKGSRHEQGNAVDIAMVNGKGFSGEQQTKSLGIYDGIMKFVNELVNMGYVKNQESGNDKAVLTFGFPGHENHIHVSRKSGGGVSTSTSTSSTSSTDTNEPTTGIQWTDILKPIGNQLKKFGFNEETNRFQRLANVITESITFSSFYKPVEYSKVTSLSKQIAELKVVPNKTVVSPDNAVVISRTDNKVVLNIKQRYTNFELTIKNLTNIKVGEGDSIKKGGTIGKTEGDKLRLEIDKGDFREWFKFEKKTEPTKSEKGLEIKNLYNKQPDLEVKNLYNKETDLEIKNLYNKGTDLEVKNLYSKNINEDIEKIKRLLK